MNRRLFLVSLSAAVCTQAQEPSEVPSAQEILAMVRRSYALQNQRLTGRLRDDDTGREEPLELALADQTMRFRFTRAPEETVHLDLSTTPATLSLSRAGGAKVAVKDTAASVRGMDFNYEDLSLRFLYWKKAEVLDANARLTSARIKCWLVRVTAPDVKGPYYTVDLWVHQDSGAVAKMEAYDAKSRLVKRFQVGKTQRVDGVMLLKEMKIESFTPDGSGKGRTYMTLDRPEKA